MKTAPKKRPSKRRKKAVPTQTATQSYMPGQLVFYPTLPPRTTTWVTKIKKAMGRMFQ